MTPRALILAGFAVLLALAIVVDLRARRPAATVRSFGDVVSTVLRSPTGRVVLLGFWLWAGWHFLAR